MENDKLLRARSLADKALRNVQIANEIKAGAFHLQLAKKYGLSEKQIRNIAADKGVSLRRMRRASAVKMIGMLMKGMSPLQISEQLNTNVDAVVRFRQQCIAEGVVFPNVPKQEKKHGSERA